MSRLGRLRKRLRQSLHPQTIVPKRRRNYRVPKTPLDSLKTTAMRLVEAEYGKPIEELLTQGSTRETARRLRVDHSTVSKWKSKLNLSYSPTNLPTCTDCTRHTVSCDTQHVCQVLVIARAGAMTMRAKMLQLEGRHATKDTHVEGTTNVEITTSA